MSPRCPVPTQPKKNSITVKPFLIDDTSYQTSLTKPPVYQECLSTYQLIIVSLTQYLKDLQRGEERQEEEQHLTGQSTRG